MPLIVNLPHDAGCLPAAEVCRFAGWWKQQAREACLSHSNLWENYEENTLVHVFGFRLALKL